MSAILEILLVAAHEEEQQRLLDVVVAENRGREGLRHAREDIVA
jgi:hypothetical protein